MGVPEYDAPAVDDLRRLIDIRLSEVGGLLSLGLSFEAVILELNNPLAALLVTLEQLCDQLLHVVPSDEQAEALRMVHEARLQGERVAATIREMSSLSPPDPPKSVALHGVLLSVLQLVERQLGDRVRVHRRLVGACSIYSREARLAQLLWTAPQLLISGMAGEAASRPFDLLVETLEEPERVSIRFASLHAPRRRGRWAEPGGGRFGILRGAVEQLGGSVVNDHSSIVLSFPTRAAVFDSESQVKLSKRDSAPPRGEMRLLVVDDDPAIHSALSRGLRELGLVQGVTSAAAAKELLQGGAMFDVVLADLVMPGGSGIELAQWLSIHRPRLRRRMILMTGMGEPQLDYQPDVIAVPKPFDLDALRELVCQMAVRG